MAQLLFDREDLETFYEYRERMITKVPLDQTFIEPIRDPTPSVSLEGDSKENYKTDSGVESQEKSTKESEKSSQNGKNKSRESEKDTTQSTEKKVEQTSIENKLKSIPPPHN